MRKCLSVQLLNRLALVFIGLALLECQTTDKAGPTNATSRSPIDAGPRADVDGRMPLADAKPQGDKSHQETKNVKIRLMIGDSVLTVTLVDGVAARDFASQLPLQLTLRDYAGKEKVCDLPRRLTTEGEPAGMDPDVGDLTYYAPWGNIAIFYRDFGYAEGLVKLGRVDSGVETLVNQRGELSVRFELAD